MILGLGVSGRAALKFLLAQGAIVGVSDSRNFATLANADQDYLRVNKIAYEGGGHTAQFCADCDAVFISPGIPTDIPLLHDLSKQGIAILGELALAAPYLTETVVAVTGTNGKTTVTALIGELLQVSGKTVFVGGNIGTPLLEYLCHKKKADVLVLELSSFQLESAGSFRPHIGVLLNITPDHMDRHGTMANYAAAKMKLFAHQKNGDSVIVGSDDPFCDEIGSRLHGQKIYCFGSLQSNCAAKGADDSFTLTLEGAGETRYSLAGTVLNSHTGLLNSEAAVLAVSLLGCAKVDIEKGLRSFSLANHRLQHVRTRAGVGYYNDSKATNTGAVRSALASFSGNIILIAGGRDKGEDYTLLKESMQEKVKELILLGEAAELIKKQIAGVVSLRHATDMKEAVKIASELATKGDTVLLAPACASFDMFENYGHRGKVFMQAVHDLPEKEVVN